MNLSLTHFFLYAVKVLLENTQYQEILIKLNKTSQELRMLSSVTINCQVTKIVMNSGSQLSELYSVSQMSQVSRIALGRCSQNVWLLVVPDQGTRSPIELFWTAKNTAVQDRNRVSHRSVSENLVHFPFVWRSLALRVPLNTIGPITDIETCWN